MKPKSAIKPPKDALVLEVNEKFKRANDTFAGPAGVTIAITPPLSEDYWALRVQVSENQAIVGFPKFSTIGIGFQHEDKDWNTNLPFSSAAQKTFDHIKHNRRDAKKSACLEAIRLIQNAVFTLKMVDDEHLQRSRMLLDESEAIESGKINKDTLTARLKGIAYRAENCTALGLRSVAGELLGDIGKEIFSSQHDGLVKDIFKTISSIDDKKFNSNEDGEVARIINEINSMWHALAEQQPENT